MSWRLANSLVRLRDQVDALYPGRSKASDGTIGDVAHQAQGSASDHNPWIIDGNGVGVVSALDLTHDPAHGLDIAALGDLLAATRDYRIKYLIRNRQVLIPADGWYWQAYTGTADPHTNHIHISASESAYDDTQQWNLKEGEDMPELVNRGDVINGYNNEQGRDPSEVEIAIYAGKVTWKQFIEALWGSGERKAYVEGNQGDAAGKLAQIKKILQ